jgi:hypothetical protein
MHQNKDIAIGKINMLYLPEPDEFNIEKEFLSADN